MPVWGWILSALGTIAAGIGLGYLIIFLFWKIEKILGPLPVIRKEIPQPVAEVTLAEEEIKEEVPVEEETVIIEEEIPVQEEIPVREEEVPEVKEESMGEATPIMDELRTGKDAKSIKFATVLTKKFNHPFRTVTAIVCWDVAVENGDAIYDTEGQVRTFRVAVGQDGEAIQRYFLVDEDLQNVISVVSGKNYIKQETTLDVDKMRRMNA